VTTYYTVGDGKSYSTIQAAIDAIPGDLSGFGIQQVQVYAKAAGYTETLDAGTGFTNASALDYIDIVAMVPHHGIEGNGIVIDFSSSVSVSTFMNSPFLRFHGFEIIAPVLSYAGDTHVIFFANNFTMFDCLFHDISHIGDQNVIILRSDSVGSIIYNCIFNISYTKTYHMIRYAGGTIDNPIYILNNIIIPGSNRSTILVGDYLFMYNNYCFGIEIYNNVNGEFSYNITSDSSGGSYGGVGNLINKAPGDQFEDNLWLKETSDCIRTGHDCSTIFTSDIGGNPRVSWYTGVWEWNTETIELSGKINVFTKLTGFFKPEHSLTYSDGHIDEMQEHLTSMFQDKDNISAFLEVYGQQIQDLEDAFWSILFKVYIDAAGGVNLDTCGDIVGEKRDGRSDDAYRVAIKVRIKINKCSGTMEQILEILHIMHPRGTFLVSEYLPAAFEIRLDGVNPDYPSKAYFDEVCRECKQAGITFFWHYQEVPSEFVFSFATADLVETSDLAGFCDMDEGEEDVGGYFSDVYLTGE